MRINSDGTRNFLYATVALIIFTVGALALIGSEQYIEDRDNHRNMQEQK